MRQLCGHWEWGAAPGLTPSPGQAPAGLPLPRIHPKLPRPRDTAGSAGGVLPAWEKSRFQHPTEPWELNCSQQGMCCGCFRAKLSQIFGPGEELDAPERTLHINRRKGTVGKIMIKKKNNPQHAFVLNKTAFSMMQREEILGLEKGIEPPMAKSEFQLFSVLTGHPIQNYFNNSSLDIPPGVT